MKIEELITAMLKENTGSHFLDSGGAYGRNWQRNQKVDFEENQPVTVDTAYNGYCLTNEVGEEVLYEPGMTFNLWIAEW